MTRRRYWLDGRKYLIRDVRKAGRFVGCEYAVRNPNGSKKWLPCAEGVQFADIQPVAWRRSIAF